MFFRACEILMPMAVASAFVIYMAGELRQCNDIAATLSAKYYFFPREP